MRKIVKIFTVITGIFSAVILSLTVYGEKTLPDSVYSNSNSIRLNGIYYANSNDCAVTASSDGSRNGEITMMNIIPVKSITVKKPERRYVAAGGELIGINLSTDGVIIVGTESFESIAGTVAPAKAAGVIPGDILVEANGIKMEKNEDFSVALNNCNGKPISLKLLRDGKEYNTVITPEKTLATGSYKAGLWIRDATGGIGTLTYTDTKTQTFASLGHGIYDSDTGILLPILSGNITNASLIGVTKGVKGDAGELLGTPGQNSLGLLHVNSDCGIYGVYTTADVSAENIYPVAYENEISEGKAQIISTVANGEKRFYDIEITNYNSQSETIQKSLTVKVTDSTLISVTGGIVQGMSGSPIIQNGRLIGAVTHVFINNPLMGYGILAEDMLKMSDELDTELDNAA